MINDTLCKLVALSHQVELPHQNSTWAIFLNGINPNKKRKKKEEILSQNFHSTLPHNTISPHVQTLTREQLLIKFKGNLLCGASNHKSSHPADIWAKLSERNFPWGVSLGCVI